MFASAVLSGLDAVMRSTVFLAFIAYAAWVVLWRPNLHIHERGVTVHNVTRSVTLPWTSLIDVDTKYALTLVTPERRVAVWVAPAPGALASQRIGRRLRKEQEERDLFVVEPGTLPGDLPGTESGDAARIIRTELTRRAEAGELAGRAGDARTDVSWNVTHGVVAVLLLVLGTVAAVL